MSFLPNNARMFDFNTRKIIKYHKTVEKYTIGTGFKMIDDRLVVCRTSIMTKIETSKQAVQYFD